MSAFIPLTRAASILAGDELETVPLWGALLVQQADELHAVRLTPMKYDSYHGGYGPGYDAAGALPDPIAPEKWQIPVVAFMAWREKHRYLPPVETQEPIEAAAKSTQADGAENKGRRVKQLSAIVAAAQSLGLNALHLATGDKQRIKTHCQQAFPKLFTEDGYKRAWQTAVDQNLVRMEDHEIFARR